MTRLRHIPSTPFEVTLMLDAGVVACSDELAHVVRRLAGAVQRYDAALVSGMPSDARFEPHNCAILFRDTPAWWALWRT